MIICSIESDLSLPHRTISRATTLRVQASSLTTSPCPKMRETDKPRETTKASFRGACYTASFLLLLTSIGLTVAAFYTTKSVHGMTLSTPWATLWQEYGALVALV